MTIADKLYSTKPDKELLKIEKKLELNTGITSIDADFGFPAGYYVIAGNPGAGKSWFALWLSRVFWKHNAKKSVYFSLEMPEPIVRQRILQQWSDLTKAQYESGKEKLGAIDHLHQDAIIVDTFYAEDSKHQTTKDTPTHDTTIVLISEHSSQNTKDNSKQNNHFILQSK